MIAICPVLLAGAQTSRFQHARLPTGHQVDPGQLGSELPLTGGGAAEQGAANQVLPPAVAGSATALGGQAEIEQGVEPNWQVPPPQEAPPPAAHVPVEKPAWLTNSRVTSRASRRLGKMSDRRRS